MREEGSKVFVSFCYSSVLSREKRKRERVKGIEVRGGREGA